MILKTTNCFALALSIFPGPALQAAENPENRIDLLVGRMTLEEKIGQLNQIDGSGDLADLREKVRSGTGIEGI